MERAVKLWTEIHRIASLLGRLAWTPRCTNSEVVYAAYTVGGVRQSEYTTMAT